MVSPMSPYNSQNNLGNQSCAGCATEEVFRASAESTAIFDVTCFLGREAPIRQENGQLTQSQPSLVWAAA